MRLVQSGIIKISCLCLHKLYTFKVLKIKSEVRMCSVKKNPYALERNNTECEFVVGFLCDILLFCEKGKYFPYVHDAILFLLFVNTFFCVDAGI